MKKIIVFILTLVTISTSTAQIRPNKTVLEKSNWEVWQSKIPVSGGVRVGLMFTNKNTKLNPSHFYVNIPKTNIKTVCIELSSKDGRYVAKLDYTIENIKQGIHQFILPTKYKKELSSYTTDEVVILASLNENCNENPKAYLLSNWGKSLKEEYAYIYINSQIPIKLVIEDIEYDCDDLESPTIAFNKKCKIPLASLKESSIIYIKQRIRRMSRVKFNFYEIPIKYIKFEN